MSRLGGFRVRARYEVQGQAAGCGDQPSRQFLRNRSLISHQVATGTERSPRKRRARDGSATVRYRAQRIGSGALVTKSRSPPRSKANKTGDSVTSRGHCTAAPNRLVRKGLLDPLDPLTLAATYVRHNDCGEQDCLRGWSQIDSASSVRAGLACSGLWPIRMQYTDEREADLPPLAVTVGATG